MNGIDATRDGKTLVIVQSNAGKLFTVTPPGVTTEIHLGDGNVLSGDGILLDGKTLYVVQNTQNKIAVIRLRARAWLGPDRPLHHRSDFDVPTTIAEHGKRLYAPNARFRRRRRRRRLRYDVVQVKKKLARRAGRPGRGDGHTDLARPRSSADRAADFESARGGSTPPGAMSALRFPGSAVPGKRGNLRFP